NANSQTSADRLTQMGQVDDRLRNRLLERRLDPDLRSFVLKSAADRDVRNSGDIDLETTAPVRFDLRALEPGGEDLLQPGFGVRSMIETAEHGLERHALLRRMDALRPGREPGRAAAQHGDGVRERGDEDDERTHGASIHSASHPSSSTSGSTA